MKRVIFLALVSMFALVAGAEPQPTGQFASNDPYVVLGVTHKITKEDLKKTYRKLAMKHHPERYHGGDPEEKQVWEKNFQQIASAYEAIESGNFKVFIHQGYRPDLQDWSRDAGFTAAGANASPEASAAPEGGAGFADFFSMFADFFQEMDRRSREYEAQVKAKAPGLPQVRHRSFFDKEIVAVYGNEKGLVIEVEEGGFYWLPSGSRTVHQLIMSKGINGQSLNRRYIKLDKSIYDPIAPGGWVSMTIREGEMLSVGDLQFRRKYHNQHEKFSETLVDGGFQINPAPHYLGEADRWDYEIYRDKKGIYYIVASDFSFFDNNKKQNSKVRFFSGTADAIQEYDVKFNGEDGSVDVPALGIRLDGVQQEIAYPIFDRYLNAFMGNINLSDEALRVTNLKKTNCAGLKKYRPLVSKKKSNFQWQAF